MKRLLLTVMITAMLAMSLGGAVLAHTPEETAEAPITAEDLFVPGTVPAQSGMLDAMVPALHGVVLAMLNQGQTSFDPSVTGWEALYNMLALYGQMDDRADLSGEELFLPSEIVMDFAAALDPACTAAADLPEELTDRMTYDFENDGYILTCGDDGLAQIRLDSSTDLDGGVEVTGTLVYLVDGSDLATFRALLIEQDNLFGYGLTSLELL